MNQQTHALQASALTTELARPQFAEQESKFMEKLVLEILRQSVA